MNDQTGMNDQCVAEPKIQTCARRVWLNCCMLLLALGCLSTTSQVQAQFCLEGPDVRIYFSDRVAGNVRYQLPTPEAQRIDTTFRLIAAVGPMQPAGGINLPNGITFTEAGVIEGSPMRPFLYAVTQAIYEVEGRSAPGLAETCTASSLLIHVVPDDTLELSSTSYTAVFTVGTDVDFVFPPPVSGIGVYGNDEITPLPADLSYEGDTAELDYRHLTGMLTTASVTDATYSLRRRIGGAVIESVPFKITINAAPTLTAPSLGDMTFTVSGSRLNLVLPAADAGTAPYDYSVTGLPDGLEFDATNRAIVGTPTKAGAYSLIYTATDDSGRVREADGGDVLRTARWSNQATATVTFSMTIGPQAPLSFATAPGDLIYQGNTPFSVVLPEATGHVGDVSYTLTLAPVGSAPGSALPAEFKFDGATRTLSGAGASTASPISLVYTASTATQEATASLDLAFTTAAPAPLSLDAPAPRTYILRVAQPNSITRVPLPAATGGVPPFTYALTLGEDGDLPANMSFNPLTRELLGAIRTRPDSGVLNLTYSVEDAVGARVTQSLLITVMLPPAFPLPSALTMFLERFGDNVEESTGDITLPIAANTRMMLLVFPELSSNVVEPIRYQLTGVLPDGLTFNTATRTLFGIPSVSPNTSGALSYIATDGNGVNTALTLRSIDTRETFRIQVAEPLTLTTASDPTVYVFPEVAFTTTLASAAGGTMSYTYSLTPESPLGLAFDDTALTLSGAPAAAESGPVLVIYSVEDALGGRAEYSFNIVLGSVAFAAGVSAPNQRFSVSQPDTTFTLPAAVSNLGSVADIRYSLVLDPVLDPIGAGLSLSGRVVSVDGSALVAGTYIATYMATLHDNTASSTASTATARLATFSVIVDSALSFAADADFDREITVGGSLERVAAFPEVENSPPSIAYTLTLVQTGSDFAIPGVGFNPATRKLTGTPGNIIGTGLTSEDYTYTYTATDSRGASTSQTASITLNSRLVLPAQANLLYTVGVDVANVAPALSEATGGSGTIAYAIDPRPEGVEFSSTTRVLSGTAAKAEVVNAIYSATDSTGTTATRPIVFTIAAAPAFAADAVAALGLRPYATDSEISLILPVVVAGTGAGTVVYSLTPSPPPSGFAFDAATRTLSGTASSSGAITFNLVATDINSISSGTLSIVLEVVAPPTLPVPADQTYTQGQEVSFELGKATGATGTLRYSLSIIPAGLAFNPATRTLAGMPGVAAPTQSIAYIVEDVHDASGDVISTVSQNFDVTINSPPQVTAPSSLLYSKGAAIAAELFPAATAGTSPYAYGLSPLPAGLTFTPATRTLSGRVTEEVGETEATYTATDVNGETATATVTISVTEPVFAADAIADQNYILGASITLLRLPAAIGGVEPIDYSLSPELPAGLALDAATRTITGMPTALIAGTVYTYTATDLNMAAGSVTFTITVVAMPMFSEQDIPNLIYTTDAATSTVTLPELTGAAGTVAYTLTPALPSPLMFDTAARTISGVGPSDASSEEYTYTGTDTVSTMAVSLTFQIMVVEGVSFGAGVGIDDQNYQQGVEIGELALPTATGGTTPIAYSLSPALPSGLDFTPATRTIAGEATAASARTEYTYTATDSAVPPSTASLTFQITVVAFVFASTEVANQTYRTEVAITNLELPTATGGTTSLTYSLSPALPAGLTFAAATRTIAGEATAASARTEYTYTVTDSATPPASGSLTFAITVNALPLPVFADAPATGQLIADQLYIQNTEIETLTLPSATSSLGIATYAVSNLPAGLSFNTRTRQITGIPTTASARAVVTYTATDAGEPSASESITFGVVVSSSAALTPDNFDAITNPIVVGASAAFDWPVIAGATNTVTFNGLPPGVTQVSAGSRQTMGSPTTSGVYPVTYTATQAPAAVVRVFQWTVSPGVTGGQVSGYTDSASEISLVLPSAVGAVAPVTYSVSALPAGFTFTPATRTVAGTPTDYSNRNSQYIATDANGVSGSAPLLFRYRTLSFVSSTIADVAWLVGTSITPQTLPVTGNNLNPVTYSLTFEPEIPGVVWNEITRGLTGTPLEAGQSVLTYTATDVVGGTMASATFTATINAALVLAGAVGDRAYSIDVTIPDLVLPAVSGSVPGTATVVYSLTVTADSSLGLPSGLTFNDSTRTLAGMPDTLGTTELTYTATFHDGTAEQNPVGITAITATFSVRVVGGLALVAALPGDFIPTYTVGRPITPLPFPAPTGGIDPLEYTLGLLPGGLAFDPATRTLTGTPLAAAPAASLTYTMTDAAGSSLRTNVSITIVNPPSLLAEIPVTLIAGLPSSRLTSAVQARLILPVAIGGAEPIVYSLAPLPAGLTFNAALRSIVGIPTTAGETAAIYTATDANGATTTTTVSINVVPGVSFVSTPPTTLTFGASTSINNPYRLPSAVGGIGNITYRLTALPAGLAFDAATRTISGIPTTVGETTAVYGARSADETSFTTDTTSANIVISIVNSDHLTYTPIADQSYGINMPITPLRLPVTIRGVMPITYRLSVVPAGLRFNPITRVLWGTPTKAGVTQVTYVARDADGLIPNMIDSSGNSVPNVDPTFRITVAEPLSSLVPDQTASVNVGSSNTLVGLGSWQGGVRPLRFSLSPVPLGLRVETFGGGGYLMGRALAVGVTEATLTATDANGVSVSVPITITVFPPLTLAEVIPNQYYTTGEVITPAVILPEAVDPAGTDAADRYSYTLSGLPGGLTFNVDTRAIAGTPAANGTFDDITYTAENMRGAIVSQSFSITHVSAPAFAIGASIAEQSLVAGTPIELATVLPAVDTGGAAPYRYSLMNAPAGIFLSERRRLVGTSASASGTTSVTYIVTDRAGSTAEIDFDVVVTDALHFAAFDFVERIYTVGLNIANEVTSSVLPEAAGGIGPYTYSVQPALPADMAFDSTARRFTGTPSAAGETEVTYTAADSATPPATVSHSFIVRVVPEHVFAPFVAQGLTVGRAAVGFVLPALLNSGEAAVVYSLSPDLPAGLTFIAATRTISGAPTAAGSFSLTLAATITSIDDPVNLAFTLQIRAASDTSNSDPVATEIPRQIVTGTARTTLSLDLTPYFSDPDGDALTYSATVDLQEGGAASTFLADASITGSLLLVRTLGKVHLAGADGTVTPSMVTITARDVFGNTATAAVSIQLVGALVQLQELPATLVILGATDELYRRTAGATSGLLGVFGYQSGATLPEGVTLAVASSSASVVTASLSASNFADGDVALGLMAAESASLGNTAIITLTATEQEGQSAAATFEVTIIAPLAFTGVIPEETIWYVGQEVVDFSVPGAVGGRAPLRYSFAEPGASDEPFLQGISLNESTFTLSGTPVLPKQLAPLNYIVTDALGRTLSLPFNLAILLPVTLPAVPAQAVTLNVQRSMVLPAASGGAPSYTYALAPVVSGMTFTPATRTWAGTPDRQQSGINPITMTYSAFDSYGVEATASFELTVTTRPVLDEEAVTQTSTALRALREGRFVDIVLPAVASGSSAVRYAVTSLPAGLAFSAATRSIYGFMDAGFSSAAAAHAVGAATPIIYTVTDAGGVTTTTTFSVNVVAAPASAPYFNTVDAVGDQVFAADTAAELVLPEASGGARRVIYGLEFAIAGMSFNSQLRALTGTPTAPGVYPLNYRAVDVNGDSALLRFMVSVGANAAPVAAPVASADTLNEGEVGMLIGDASLPADATLTYQWRQIAAEGDPIASIAEPAAATTAFTAPGQLVSDVTLVFGLVVTNANNIDSAEARVLVRVIAGMNDAPTANAGADQRANSGDQVVLDGTGSSDPEGEALTYDWSQTAGPMVTLSSKITSSPVFDAPANTAALLSVTFSLSVTDARGLTSKSADSVTVVIVNTEARAATVKTLLAAVGRTLGADAVDTITGRFDPNAGAPVAVLSGYNLVNLAAWRTLFDGGALTSGAGYGYDLAASASPFSSSIAANSYGTWPQALAAASPTALEQLFDQSRDLIETIGNASSIKDLLADTRFSYNLRSGAAAGQNAIVLWGQGSFNSFSGNPDSTLKYDGDLSIGYLGVDWQPNARATVGLAFGFSDSELGFQSTLIGEGSLDTEISTLYLYGNAELNSGLSIWGAVGQSVDGSLTLTEDSGAKLSADLSLGLYAIGLRQHLATRNRTNFAVTLDGFISTLESDAVSGLPVVEAEASRLRVAITAEGRVVAGDNELIPSVELGIRYDGGDAETGVGLDVEGAFTVENDSGFSITARGRTLIVHAESDLDDFGGSIAVSFAGGDQGRGLNLSLKPVWGQDETGAKNLWNQDRLFSSPLEQANDRRPSLHMAFNASYGMLSNKMLITPFSELDMQDADDYRLRVGARWDLKAFNIELYAEQDNSAVDVNEQRVALSFTWHPAAN